MSDAWYLDAGEYYVARRQARRYPRRQGDLLGPMRVGNERWFAAQMVHPTCELGKDTVKKIQVARVRPLSDLEDDHLRALTVTGYSEDAGHRRVALAHTFFLPPWDPTGEPCFANFREIARVDRAAIGGDSRIATLTHDCRVAFIRRWLYWRFRLIFDFDQVHAWEARRIATDSAFEGPRPSWSAGA